MGSLMEARRRILLSSPHLETIQNADIASFSTDMRSPLRSLRIGIDPVQDLHGYDAPWPAGGGKNKLPNKILKENAYRMQLGINNISDWIPLKAGTYKVSVGLASGITGTSIFWKKQSASAVESSTITLSDDDSVHIWIFKDGLQTSDVLWWQCESGSTATPYSPYSNECPITGWSAANLWRTGKNLCSVSSWSGHSGLAGALDTPIPPNTTFTMSGSFTRDGAATNGCAILFGFSDGTDSGWTSLTVNSGERKSATKTFPKEIVSVKYYASNVGWSDSQNYTLTAEDFQIELSSTPTTYSPYSGNQFTIQLGQTVYGGTLDVLSGVLTVDRAYALLNDPDKWVAASSTTQDFEYTQLFNDRKLYSTSFQGLICSAFAVNISAAVYMRWTSSSSKKIGIKNNTSAYTLSDIQQMAQGNQIAIVYELATPLHYPLSSIAISTLAGQNVVWGDSGKIELLKYWTHK